YTERHVQASALPTGEGLHLLPRLFGQAYEVKQSLDRPRVNVGNIEIRDVGKQFTHFPLAMIAGILQYHADLGTPPIVTMRRIHPQHAHLATRGGTVALKDLHRR